MGLQGKRLADKLLGRKTLILGDVGTGKTAYTAEILKPLLVLKEKITVIDLGPEKGNVGLSLIHYVDMPGWVRYMRPEALRAPRLEGRDASEVLMLAKHNSEEIRPLLLRYLKEPTPVLVMNDLSIYLQAGPLEELLKCVRKSSTFLGNAYYGSSLEEDKGSGISNRERILVEELMAEMDYLIFMLKPSK